MHHGVVVRGLVHNAQLFFLRGLYGLCAVDGRVIPKAVVCIIFTARKPHAGNGFGGGVQIAALHRAPHAQGPFIKLAVHGAQVHGVIFQKQLAVCVQVERVGSGKNSRGHHDVRVFLLRFKRAEGAVLNGGRAHGVACHANAVQIHIGQRLHILQRRIGAHIGRKAAVDLRVGEFGMAVAIGVNGHHHIAALGKLYAVQVLHLGRVVVTMARDDGRRLCLGGNALRDVKQGPQVPTVLCDKADILNLHFAARGVGPLGQGCAE